MWIRIARVAAIVALATLLGLAWNKWSGRGLALDRNVLIRDGDEVIAASSAKERFDRGALFLDARPVDFYNMEHIPGAESLPEDGFERAFARLETRLRSRFDLVVYCSGFGCEASHIVARKLRDRGIHIAILNDGWPAWTEAGYPVKVGAAP